MVDRIEYRSLHAYKYQTMRDYSVSIPLFPQLSITSSDGWIRLTPGGLLQIRKGYCWDGPSGPAIDTKNFMRGSLLHDALYQLMRENKLPQDCRKIADEVLKLACLEDGMSGIRANWVYWAVQTFARRASTPRPLPETQSAP